MAVYTKTGDTGTTGSLVGRMGKAEQIPQVLGALDEFNSLIGFCRYLIMAKKIQLTARKQELENIQEELVRIQDNLMTIAAIVAGGKLRLSGAEAKHLENLIDTMSEEMPKLRNFVYPVGPLQLARAVARRAEREVVKYVCTKGLAEEAPKQAILKYMNRVSDALFVMARKLNYVYNFEERVWKKRE